MTFGSLFSGIGLFDLGLQRAGLGSPAWQVEIDPWCRTVLERHYPAAQRFADVRDFTPPTPAPRIIAGGFPCQPVSVAGLRLAQDDHRWLWPEFARIVRAAEPAIVIAENVPGLRTAGLRDVLADLAALGFDAEWTCFTAGSVGAAHRRDRLWLVAAHPDRCQLREQQGREPGLRGHVRRAQAVQHRLDLEVRAAADAACVRRSHAGPERAESPGRPEAVGDAPPYAGGDGHQGSDAPQRSEEERRASGGLRVAHTDGEGRVQLAVRVATERGWAGHCGWHLDPLARVDDGSTAWMGGAGGSAADAIRALGNAVVVRCAQLVGEYVRESFIIR